MKHKFESKPFSKDVNWEGTTFKSYSIKIADVWHNLKCQDKSFDMSQITKGTELECEVRTNAKGFKELWILKDFESNKKPATSLETPFNMPLEKDFDLINQKLDRIINQNDELKDKYEVLIKVLNDIPNIEVPF